VFGFPLHSFKTYCSIVPIVDCRDNCFKLFQHILMAALSVTTPKKKIEPSQFLDSRRSEPVPRQALLALLDVALIQEGGAHHGVVAAAASTAFTRVGGGVPGQLPAPLGAEVQVQARPAMERQRVEEGLHGVQNPLEEAWHVGGQDISITVIIITIIRIRIRNTIIALVFANKECAFVELVSDFER